MFFVPDLCSILSEPWKHFFSLFNQRIFISFTNLQNTCISTLTHAIMLLGAHVSSQFTADMVTITTILSLKDSNCLNYRVMKLLCYFQLLCQDIPHPQPVLYFLFNRFCHGCVIKCSEQEFGCSSSYIAIEWDPTTLHLRYQSSQEKVSTEHESVERSRKLQTEPIDLYECFRAFTKEEELGEDELWCVPCGW